MKSKYLFFCILCISTLTCKKSKPPPPIDYTPAKTELLIPANNEACYSGDSTSATQSKVTFQWTAATNAETYRLTFKNLETGEVSTTVPISSTQVDISLLQNTPYSWFIVAKSSKTTANSKSDTWKFYNSGKATKSFAPFPAEIVYPLFDQAISAASGQIKLSWIGSDVDKDIDNYKVYFGTTKNPPLKQSDLVSNTLNVSVTSGTTYYWKVITKDKKNNTSDSGIYQFSVN